MILIAAQVPTPAAQQEGMGRRIGFVDQVLGTRERVYVQLEHRPIERRPVEIHHVDKHTRSARFNWADPVHVDALGVLAEKARCVLVHSIYEAFLALPLYQLAPVITDLHGAVPEEQAFLGAPAEWVATLASLEAFVVRRSVKLVAVGQAMEAHLRSKYGDAEAELITLPVVGTAVRKPRLEKPGPFRSVYSGGVQPWQNVERMLKAVAAAPKPMTLELLTPSVAEAQRLSLEVNVPNGRVEIRSEDSTRVSDTYGRCHFGFVLRDDHVLNRVASPTKLYEYLAHEVVPIVLSPEVGDYDALGFRYLSLAAFLAGKIPTHEAWREMVTANLKVVDALQTRASAGIDSLLRALDADYPKVSTDELRATFSYLKTIGANPLLETVGELAKARGALAQANDLAAKASVEADRKLAALEAQLSAQVTARATEVDALRGELGSTRAQLTERDHLTQLMRDSLSWKFTDPLRRGNQFRRRAERWVARFLESSRAEGLGRALEETRARIRGEPLPDANDRRLAETLREQPSRPVIVSRPFIDWAIPLFQRPQHIARHLANEGFLYFFVSPKHIDRVDGFESLGEGLFLSDQFDKLLALKGPRTLHVYSTDYYVELDEIRRAQQRGDSILYEYIDEIHPDLWSKDVPARLVERHRAMVADASVYCVATARKLLDEVHRVRTHNTALVTNGVDVAHFARPREASPPPEIAGVVARGGPVIGYHGAFAKWFDYELVRFLCEARPRCEIVLIGADVDGSLAASGISKLSNLTVAGPVPYADLPKYSAWFDVAMVPFKLNAITEAISPIKLFEYMALGKPAVTTDLPECRQYRSVLLARDPHAFVNQIDRALLLQNDSKHGALLKEEALQNTWQAKAHAIAQLLRGH